MRKTRSAVLGVVAAAVFAGTVAYAGSAVFVPVQVDTTYFNAFGSVASTRGDGSPDSYIGCVVYTYSSATSSVVTTNCWARSPSMQYGSCWSISPSIAQVAQSVSGDSFINFYWDPATNECTYLEVANASMFEPKK